MDKTKAILTITVMCAMILLSSILLSGCSSSPYEEIKTKSEYYYKHNTFKFDFEEDTSQYMFNTYIKYVSQKGKTYYLDAKLTAPDKSSQTLRFKLSDKEINLFNTTLQNGTYTLEIYETPTGPVIGNQVFVHVYRILNSTQK